jgi:L-seryl-tRNA(Ser) seleniumtransferase
MPNMLPNIPSVSELLESPPLKSLVNRVNRNVVVSGVRQFLDDMRTQVQSAAASIHVPTSAELAERIAHWIATDQHPSLVPVINATGVILHPLLGGAPLAQEAVEMAAAAARSHASLDLNLASGENCERGAAVERLLTRLAGAEAATVVNNPPAAMLVVLAAVAPGREVLVSRGQLIEIGDRYRLPDMVRTSGAILREVGTTNKTRLSDYAAAIGPQSAALMRVHASNYTALGSIEETPLSELVALGRKENLPVIDDIGSGGLADVSRYGIRGERIAGDSVRAGADLVLFSGDKLLGGPACGIIVGRRSLIGRVIEHPLMSATRVDKLTLAALAATLRLYQDPALAERSIPLLSLLSTPLENLRQRAERIAPQIAATGVASVEIAASQASLEGEALPHQTLPSVCLVLTPLTVPVEGLASALRVGTPAVMGRMQDGKLMMDLRSVQPRDDLQLVAAVEKLRPANAQSGASSTSAAG